MAVLSTAPARPIWNPSSLLLIAAAHGLILSGLFAGMSAAPPPDEPVTIALVMVEEKPADAAVVATAEPQQEIAPTEPVIETTIEPALPAPAPKIEVAAIPAAQPPIAPSLVRPAAHPPTPRPSRVLAARQSAVAAPAVASAVAASTPAISAPTKNGQAEQMAEDALRRRIRDAVQAAVRCPPAARMMGQSGKAGVTFDYRDGALIGGVQLARSTGTPILDEAALSAVRDARYPKPPQEVGSRPLRLLIWVEEACGP
jgi:periplasmic protein TonB